MERGDGIILSSNSDGASMSKRRRDEKTAGVQFFSP